MSAPSSSFIDIDASNQQRHSSILELKIDFGGLWYLEWPNLDFGFFGTLDETHKIGTYCLSEWSNIVTCRNLNYLPHKSIANLQSPCFVKRKLDLDVAVVFVRITRLQDILKNAD